MVLRLKVPEQLRSGPIKEESVMMMGMSLNYGIRLLLQLRQEWLTMGVYHSVNPRWPNRVILHLLSNLSNLSNTIPTTTTPL